MGNSTGKEISAATWVPVAALKPWLKNPRKNDPAVPRVAESIRRFGFVAPIVVWTSADRMVAGHTRLKAILSILDAEPDFIPKGAPGPGVVPVRWHEFESEKEADLYALADNRLGELAEWDGEALKGILPDFDAMDLRVAGFDDYELPKDDEEKDPNAVPSDPADCITQLGDVWKLGDHRLICGDSTDIEVLDRLMAGELVDLLWTDPPYNVAYEGGTAEKLTIMNDKMDDGSFADFLALAFVAADKVMREGASFYIAHADLEGYNFRGAVKSTGWKLAQCLVWVKDSLVMGRSDYHWRHEPILYGWKLGAGHYFIDDRKQDTIWEFPKPRANKEHPTMKPVELIERAIQNSSKVGAIVLDSFGGSGSTLIACERTRRKARLVELDPKYCDVIVKRWAELTGKSAVREDR